MPSRLIISFILPFAICIHLHGQTGTKPKAPWQDSTFKTVRLVSKIDPDNIICFEIGNKASIFVSFKSVWKQVKNEPSEEYKKLKDYLDSAQAVSDSIFIEHVGDFDFIISNLLQKGKARIFYKRDKTFTDSITHRLEKYGMYAVRFFYLPDGRPFFSSMEYSGIIEKGKYFSDPTELGELYKKLASERKE